MKIPSGMTEDEVMKVIDIVAVRLARKYRFGYHGIEDIQQQARMHAWEGLAKYDNKRPLENFLWTHVRNRLHNDKRNKFCRPDKVCLNCPLSAYIKETDGCKLYEDLEECNIYAKWLKRNTTKKNLMQTIDITHIVDKDENNIKSYNEPDEKLIMDELNDLIDENMPNELRQHWIKIKYGIKVSKNISDRVLGIVEEVKKKYGWND